MKSDEIPSIDQVFLEVPSLGTLKGISLNGKTCQYLGIPYASVPGRFRRSVPASEPWENGNWDGTRLGPYCPQPPRDFYPVPNAPRPWLDMPQADEFNCLNLNISVPHLPADQVKNPLPVMIFIHGGAFTYSMNSSPVYDSRILVESSASKFRRPTIVITVNYRLGVYGFLAGKDIETYNSSHGEAGVGNYGLWDQVLALRWVQKHISAFGGDPKQVTLFGQSAGAVSVHAHLLRGEPLFSSAILQSGLIRLCGVLSIDEYQSVYERILQALDIPIDLNPEDRIERLLSADSSALTKAMVPAFIIPVVTSPLCDDGVFVTGSIPSYDEYYTFSVPEWCPRVMIGDATNECIIWNKSWDNICDSPLASGEDLTVPTAALTLAKMESYLGSPKARMLSEIYDITSDTSEKDIFTKLEKMTTHGLFSAPIYFARQAAKGSVFAYHFDVPSPFKNAWGGMAHHSFDNVLIWGLLSHEMPQSYAKVSEYMAEAWIRFASGEDPWERHSESGKYKVFGLERTILTSKNDDLERGHQIWDKLHDLGLVADLARLSEELCLRRRELTQGVLVSSR
ncbi:unnamed protein product [Clonostachys rosea f. rosea IK726]|uniref:Uncharacterized protein n=2 Tax=Bionectria ochroleuca TaxID=29856 RepID=A0ACA9TQG9_BIOOC|nr:unnamed protein product [Clonostachys rosea f. rosea IK726]